MFGASFGHRGFTESLAVMALPLACLVEWVMAKGMAWRVAASATAASLMLLSLVQMYNYWIGLIPGYNADWEKYINALKHWL
jgi:membrane-bound metal-dependent hydrolase YbcI (DUF457 family)